jgi:FG-GAP-like repeat
MYIRENRLAPVGRDLPPAALPPDMQAVLPYFTSRAPERLAAPEPWPAVSESPLQFARVAMTLAGTPGSPAVSNVRLVDLDGDGKLDVLGADMRHGVVFSGHPGKAGSTLTTIANSPNPSHVSPADVDKDGVMDLLVSDLGTFYPEDHDKGSVVWLRGAGGGKYAGYWLDGWPRVADVEAADFGGRGWNDLAIAAFGWRKTGRIAIMENRTTNPRQPSFTEHVIDPRTGAIHVIPIDLNRDGKMDFVALLAQEHETVVAYLNQGDFRFEQKAIYQAPHANWGSTGIEAADLDKDGDLDILLTHGDTFDDGIVKPYHGIQWLENRGSYPYVEHTIAGMAGVHRAEAADLDGDGDLDVVACALLAAGSDVDEQTLPALVWLEQTKPGLWAKHTIEMGFPRHATLDVGDIDGDGLPDIVTGKFSSETKASGWVDVWITSRRR